MIKIEFTDTEWEYMVSVIHLDSLKGDKQSERLLQKLLQRRNEQQDYQCGDDCKGECSGEVDGFVHCPYDPQAEREIYKHIAEQFFEWLDNIDTADDLAKNDDSLYRSLVSREHKKRFRYAKPDGSLMDLKELRQVGE